MTEKQRLLQPVQAAALVQAALVHRGAGLTIHLDETAAAGIRVPVTGFRLPVDRRAKPAIVSLQPAKLIVVKHLTVERTRAGLDAARRQGRTGGRKRKMDGFQNRIRKAVTARRHRTP